MPELVPLAITRWLEKHRLTLRAIEPLHGGSVARISCLQLSDYRGRAQSVVLKQMPAAPATLFSAEAAGLQALAECQRRHGGGLRIPAVYWVDAQCLLLEYLPAAQRTPDFERQLGTGVARQHQQRAATFGFAEDTFCGGTRQTNRQDADGYRFFAEQRLMALAQVCVERQRLRVADAHRIDRIAAQLTRWIPPQPPVLLHGDLWYGNVLSGPAGEPVLIDPAVYYGWAEADLAMTQLFGGFGAAFYAAYGEVNPLEPGWQERVELYNLYHYLNHLLLFGGGYLSDVRRIVKYYSG